MTILLRVNEESEVLDASGKVVGRVVPADVVAWAVLSPGGDEKVNTDVCSSRDAAHQWLITNGGVVASLHAAIKTDWAQFAVKLPGRIDYDGVTRDLQNIGKRYVSEYRVVRCPLIHEPRWALEKWLRKDVVLPDGWCVNPYLGAAGAITSDSMGTTLRYLAYRYEEIET